MDFMSLYMQQNNKLMQLCLCISDRLSTEMLLSKSATDSMTSAIHSWPCSGTTKPWSAITQPPNLTRICREGQWGQILWLC